MELKEIAHIRTDFREKFGIPRQSGLVPSLQGMIIFEQEYRDLNAFKGIEGYSHLWLLWQFSRALRDTWSPTVQPPRLGGNTHMGVFATRSPYRPNPIGLSSVRLEKFDIDPKCGPVLYVSGADLMDGTPIYDIKPYLSYTDSHPDAVCGFADRVKEEALQVEFPEELLNILPENKREAAAELLSQDPRPHYQKDPSRRYGMAFAGFDIRFYVDGRTARVCEIENLTTHEIYRALFG